MTNANAVRPQPVFMTVVRGRVWCLAALAWSTVCGAEQIVQPGVLIDVVNLRGVDLEGGRHRFAESEDCPCAIVVFLSTRCPISNGYIPELQKLANSQRRLDVEFYGVISDPHTTREAAIAHRDEYRITFPVLFDGAGDLRAVFGATHTPQAFVVSRDGALLYSGRIDDRFSQIGRRRDAASVHDLRDAVRQVVAGLHIEVPLTEPVGCRLEERAKGEAGSEVTFNRDIAPILLANCTECHREGQSAPFPLEDYDDAVAHAQQMVEVTRSRFMPPWHPEPGFGHFLNERRLTEGEISLLRAWVEAGKPEGNPQDACPKPSFPDGWRLGKPDLILKMADAFELDADGPDVHQHFVLPTGLRNHRLVSAVEFRPGNARVTHHACFYVDTHGAARQLDARFPDVGYGSFSGPGFATVGNLRSWLPGQTPQHLPDGFGQLLHADSDLVLEIHYQRTGKAESDQSTVGIHFADASARRLVSEIQVMNKSLHIPAGESRHEHRASYTLPVNATLLDAAPHMHLLGREMKATATLPNGTTRPLIWIKDWDFNWQGQYLYGDTMRLPKGTRIDVTAWYDNTAGNRLNPHVPPQTVHWGEETQDEMGVCHFRYACDTIGDLETMHGHYLSYLAEQQRRYGADVRGQLRMEGR